MTARALVSRTTVWPQGAGWMVSALLHAGVIALTLLTLKPMVELAVPPEMIAVELLPISEKTNVRPKAKAETPKPSPQPAAVPDPKPAMSPAPAPERPADPPPPAPVPKAETLPAPPQTVKEDAPPAPVEKPRAKVEPPKEEVKPAAKPKPAEDFDAILRGLADKENRDQTTEQAQERRASAEEKPQRAFGDPMAAESMAIIDAFRTQVSKCWNPPVGAAYAETLVVSLRVTLNPDGSLSGMPEYRDTSRMSDPAYRAAAEAARRAIIQCQAYTLPAEGYAQWSVLDVDFDPRKMLGL